MQTTPEQITTTFAPETRFEIKTRVPRAEQIPVSGLPDSLMPRGFRQVPTREGRGVPFSAIND